MTTEGATAQAPPRPGWHPDPLDGAGERWHDGEGWTSRVRRPDLPWRQAGGLAATLAWALVMSAAVYACLAYVYHERHAILGAMGGTRTRTPAFEDNERVFTIFGLAALGLTVAVVVLWLVWFRIAYGNARTLRDVRLPRWTVWAWVVPVANVVLPRLMVGDLWAAGDERRDGDDRLVHPSRLVTAWWLTFVAALAVLMWGDSLTKSESPDRGVRLEALERTSGILRFGFAIAALAALLAALVVLRATVRLHRRRSRTERR